MTIGLQAYLQGYLHEKTAAPLKDQTVSTPWTKIDAGEVPSGESLSFWRTDAVKGKKMPGFKRQPDPRPETLDAGGLLHLNRSTRYQGDLKPTVPLPDMKGQLLFSPRTGGYVADEDVSVDDRVGRYGEDYRDRYDAIEKDPTFHKLRKPWKSPSSLHAILRSARDGGGTVTTGKEIEK